MRSWRTRFIACGYGKFDTAEMKDIAELVEAYASKPKRPATYRKRGDAATISN